MSDEMKDVFGNKVVFADRHMVIRNQEPLAKLLTAIGREMCSDGGSPEGWAANCWVSDMSTMPDFGLEPEAIERISREVNVAINEDDYIYAILARMGGAQ